MKYIVLILSIFFYNSCDGLPKPTSQDDYLIINSYLNKFEHPKLASEAYFSATPKIFFGNYLKWKNSIINENFEKMFFGKNQKWIFDDEEIDYMKKRYQNWNRLVWDKKYLKHSTIVINTKGDSSNNSYDFKIGYPFYDITAKKAMLIVSSIKGRLDSSIVIYLFKKIDGIWMQVGAMPYSVS
ncbi:hypothetical protein [Dokdonia sp. PRO95]|uniref:hypothetical protein n=1 Tax=Dokdonia sp. PRO95 TaxID=1239415 RepID=UPI00054FCC23|nr:hypothetical protein [Dokdonia sp. PRO95]